MSDLYQVTWPYYTLKPDTHSNRDTGTNQILPGQGRALDRSLHLHLQSQSVTNNLELFINNAEFSFFFSYCV